MRGGGSESVGGWLWTVGGCGTAGGGGGGGATGGGCFALSARLTAANSAEQLPTLCLSCSIVIRYRTFGKTFWKDTFVLTGLVNLDFFMEPKYFPNSGWKSEQLPALAFLFQCDGKQSIFPTMGGTAASDGFPPPV